MTTDATVTTELSDCTNDNGNSSLVTSVKVCFASVDRSPLQQSVKALLLLVISFCHLIVVIVCVRERKKASYKQDIVYMVALAMVDMAFCVSILIPLQGIDTGLHNSVAFRNLPVMLMCMSVVLLAIRAVERCKIVIRQQAKSWPFRFQMLLCMASTIFVAIPIEYLDYLTNIPFVPIFWCVVSLVILVSYGAIVWKILTQSGKSRRRNECVPRMTLFQRRINVIDVDSTLKQRHVPRAGHPQNMVTDQNNGKLHNATEILQIPNTASISLVPPKNGTGIPQVPRANIVSSSLVPPQNGTEISQIPRANIASSSFVRPENGTEILQIPRANTASSSLVPPQNGTEISQIPRANIASSSLVPPQNGTEISQIPGTNIAGSSLVPSESFVKEKIMNEPVLENKNEVCLAQTHSPLGKGNEDVFGAHTSNQLVNGTKYVALVEGGKQMGNSGVKNRSSIHGNKSQISAQREKGQHIRRAGWGLVLITILFFLSVTPAWIADVVDGAPCYLKLFSILNGTVNPFIYFAMIKSFRQAVCNLMRTCLCKCCKLNQVMGSNADPILD